MDRISMYLQIVPLPVLILIGLVGAVTVLVVPNRLRLVLLLSGLPLWLALSRFPTLGAIQAFSKTTGMLYFALIVVAAILEPGPKRRVPVLLWLYPILGLLSVFYVLGARDAAIAALLRVQWFFLTLAAIFVLRTITDEQQLRRFLKAILIGSSAAALVAFAAVVQNPRTAFAAGLGRIRPWGANQNQVGPVFIVLTPLALYFGMRLRGLMFKLSSLAMCGIGGIMALLTGSRSVVYPLALLMAVVGWELRRKPLVVIAAAIVLVPIGLYTSGFLANADVNRLGSLESGRYELWLEYSDVIMEHPMFGIMFQDDVLATSEEDIGNHAHNAYIDSLRVYGLSLSAPLFALAAWSCWSAFQVWLRRKSFCSDPLLITMLVAFLAMVYFHGMVTLEIYYSNYTWAFFHVFLSSLFITLASDRGREFAPQYEYFDSEAYAYDETLPEWSAQYPAA